MPESPSQEKNWQGSPLRDLPQDQADGVRKILRDLKDDVAESAAVMEKGIHRTFDRNVKYLEGKQESGNMTSGRRTNVLLPKFHRLIANLFAHNPEVMVQPSIAAALIENFTEQQVRLIGDVAKAALTQVIMEGRLKQAALAALRDSRVGGFGIIKIHQPETGHFALTNLSRVKELIQAKAKEYHEARDPSTREKIQAEVIRLGTELAENITRDEMAPDIVFEHIPFKAITIDRGIQDYTRYEEASFIDQKTMLTPTDFAAQFPEVPPRLYEQASRYRRDRDRAAGMPDTSTKQSMVELHQTWHRDTASVYFWIDNSEDPIIQPTPASTSSRFYPYFLIPDLVIPERASPTPSVSLWRASQDRIDLCDSKLDSAREGIKSGHFAMGLTAESLDRASNAPDGAIVVVETETPGADIRTAILPRQTAQIDPLLVAKDGPRQDIELASGDVDPARAQQHQRTATAAQNIEQARIVAQGLSHHEIESTLEDALNYALELVFLHYSPEKIASMGINTTAWPVGDPPPQLLKAFKVKVRDGSIGTKDKRSDQENIVNLMNTLLPLVEQINVYEITRMQTLAQAPMPPDQLALLVEARHLRNLAKRVIMAFDESIDPNEMLPIPITGMPPEAAIQLPPETPSGGNLNQGPAGLANPGEGNHNADRQLATPAGQGATAGVNHPVNQPGGNGQI